MCLWIPIWDFIHLSEITNSDGQCILWQEEWNSILAFDFSPTLTTITGIAVNSHIHDV